MTRSERIKQNERLRSRYEKFFKQKVKQALKYQYSSYTSLLKDHGTSVTLPPIVADGLAQVIQKMYVIVGISRASLTFNELNRLPKVQRKDGSIGFYAQWTSEIIEYFKIHLFDKVVLPISETTREWIQKVITQGIIDGWSLDKMIQEIEREDYIDGRSERILRTEITRAINYGNQLAAQNYGFQTQKKWIAVHDNRTRHWHLEADGQQVAIDGSFTVGGEPMDFPGDPNASAANVINCRCVTEIVPMRDVQGRLISKDKNQVRIRGRLRSQVQEIIQELLN